MFIQLLWKALLTVFLGLMVLHIKAGSTVYPAPPVVKQTSGPRLLVPVGQEVVKLRCNVRNAQAYTWYKNGAQISGSLPERYSVRTYRFLQITNAVKSDSGLFFCVTSNSVGTANCSIELLVEDPNVSPTGIQGEKPQFLNPKQMESVKENYKEGDEFELTCEAKGVPSPVVTWYKDGEAFSGRSLFGHMISVPPGPYDYKIVFSEVDISDRGTYTCNVSNAYGWLNYTYTIFVQEGVRSKPQIYFTWEQKFPLYVGESVEIFCKVMTKDPKTKYRWYYSNSDIPDKNKLGRLIDLRRYKQPPYIIEDEMIFAHLKFTLRLENLTIDQSGFYGCQAENSVGNGSRQTNVTVVYRPVTVPVTRMTTDTQEPKVVDERALAGREKSGNERSFTSTNQFLGALIGVVVLLLIVLISVPAWLYWKIKKTRAFARSRRPGIDSIHPRYDVKNEYVVVPEFKL